MGEYTTGDIDLKVNITSEKNVTIDYIVNEATQMWKESKRRNIKFGDLDAADALMNEFRKSNPQFCKSYPIVLRYMVQMKQFSPDALRKYILKIKENPWKNEEDYINSQADYAVLLYKATTRWNKTEASRIHTGVKLMLKRETEIFKHHVQEFDKEISAKEEMLKKQSVDDFKNFVKIAADTIESRGGTVRVETDLPSVTDFDFASLVMDTNSQLCVTAEDLLG